MLATKINCVAAAEIFRFERRNRYALRPQIPESPAEPRQIGSFGQNRKICVTAKLGRAVKYAGLPAHEQGANAVRAH